jgi:hypothetical protein
MFACLMCIHWLVAGITILINIFLHCCNFISVQNAIKPVTFSCLLHIRHLKEMEMAGVKLLETCPYCGFADMPAKEDQVFCCLNLDCMRETCRSVTFFTWCNSIIKVWSILTICTRWISVISRMISLLDSLGKFSLALVWQRLGRFWKKWAVLWHT